MLPIKADNKLCEDLYEFVTDYGENRYGEFSAGSREILLPGEAWEIAEGILKALMEWFERWPGIAEAPGGEIAEKIAEHLNHLRFHLTSFIFAVCPRCGFEVLKKTAPHDMSAVFCPRCKLHYSNIFVLTEMLAGGKR